MINRFRLFKTLIGILFVLVGVFFFFAATEPGLNLAFAMLRLKYPEIKIEKLQGSIAHGIHAENIEYTSPEGHFLLEQLHVHWQPIKLLEHKLVINKLSIHKIHLYSAGNIFIDSIHSHASWYQNRLHIPYLRVRKDQFINISHGTVDLNSQLSFDMSIDTANRTKDFDNFVAHSRLKGSPDNLIIESEIKTPYRAQVKLMITQGHIVDGSARWQHLQWPLVGKADYLSKAGHATIKGTKSAYKINSQFDLTGPSIPDSKVNFSASGDNNSLRSDNIDLQSLDGHSHGKLSIQWDPYLQWNLRVDTKDINPAKKWPSQVGKLSFRLQQRGSNKNNKLVAHTTLDQLVGQLQQQPIRGHLTLDNDNKQFHFSNSELIIADNKVTINGGYKDAWNLQLALSYDTEKLSSLFASDNPASKARLKSQLNLLATVSGKDMKTLLINVDGKLSPGKFIIPIDEKHPLHVFSGGQLHVSLAPKGLTGKVNLNFNKHDFINADIHLPDYQVGPLIPQQRIQATVNSQLNDISFLESLLTQLKDIKGRCKGLIEVDGTVKAPKFKGSLHLDHAQFMVPRSNITLNNIDLRAISQNTDSVTFKGSLQSGKGTLFVNGMTQFGPHIKTSLKLSGKDVLLSNTPQFYIEASPDLSIELRKSWHIKGAINIPKANIRPSDFTSTITLPDETEFTDKQHSADAIDKKNPINSTIEITLGDDVKLKYAGIDGHLHGKLTISDQPNKPTTAVGSIYVKNGKYTFKDKQLDIKQGRISYNGEQINNPNISARASRVVPLGFTSLNNSLNAKNPLKKLFSNTDNFNLPSGMSSIEAGVVVSGNLKKPKVRFYSNPSLPTPDIMSYLLFGKSYSQATDSKNALATLAGIVASSQMSDHSTGGFKKFINKLKIDEIGVKSSSETGINPRDADGDDTQLVLGKALSPRLYIRYISSIIGNNNYLVQINYKIRQNLILQGTTGSNDINSADIIYRLDKKVKTKKRH